MAKQRQNPKSSASPMSGNAVLQEKKLKKELDIFSDLDEHSDELEVGLEAIYKKPVREYRSA